MKTKVTFRKFNNGDIIALFFETKENPFNPNACISYMHIGQHSESDLKYVLQTTKLATYNEYKELYNELTEIGYDLEVYKAIPKRVDVSVSVNFLYFPEGETNLDVFKDKAHSEFLEMCGKDFVETYEEIVEVEWEFVKE